MSGVIFPLMIHGAAFALGLVLWYMPEVYNSLSWLSRALFPDPEQQSGSVDAEGIDGDEQDELEHERDDWDFDDDDSKHDVESPGRRRKLGDDDDGLRGPERVIGSDEVEKAAPKQETDKDTAEAEAADYYDSSPTMRLLRTYINSVLGIDRGVFSQDSFLWRLFHEWSLHNCYTAILCPQVNGPYGVLVERRESQAHDSRRVAPSPFSPAGSSPVLKSSPRSVRQGALRSGQGEGAAGSLAAPPVRIRVVLSTGAWNRLIRALRVVTAINITFTVLGLLYYKQYPNITSVSQDKCKGLTTRLQCLDESVVFIDTVSFCAYDEASGTCLGNSEPVFNIKFLVLATLLAALVVSPAQWLLDVLFDTLLVFPKKEKPAFQSGSGRVGVSPSVGRGADAGMVNDSNSNSNSNMDDDDDENFDGTADDFAAAIDYSQDNWDRHPRVARRLLQIMQTDVEQTAAEDLDAFTYCPAVDNARRHRNLELVFRHLEKQSRSAGFWSSMESGQAPPLSPNGHGNTHHSGLGEGGHGYFDRHKFVAQGESDVVSDLYAKFQISSVHDLKDKSMRKLVELLALFESLKAYRESLGVGLERAAFDQQWGIVPFERGGEGDGDGDGHGDGEDPKDVRDSKQQDQGTDFYLLGRAMLVRDDQTTLYDVLLMHLFNKAENYVDVSEVEIRMAEAKQIANDALLRVSAASRIRSDANDATLSCRCAFEAIRLFGVDVMGGSQSVAARLYMERSGRLFPFTLDPPLAVRDYMHVGAWSVIVLANALSLAVSCGVFNQSSAGWSYGWFTACCMHIFLDFVVYQGLAVVFTAFVVPDQVSRSVRFSLMLAAPALCYTWALSHHQITHGATETGTGEGAGAGAGARGVASNGKKSKGSHAAAPVRLSGLLNASSRSALSPGSSSHHHNNQDEDHDHDYDDDQHQAAPPAPRGIAPIDVHQSLLCAPKFLYASRRLADKLPCGFEGDLVRRFNTPWVVPALRPVRMADRESRDHRGKGRAGRGGGGFGFGLGLTSATMDKEAAADGSSSPASAPSSFWRNASPLLSPLVTITGLSPGPDPSPGSGPGPGAPYGSPPGLASTLQHPNKQDSALQDSTLQDLQYDISILEHQLADEQGFLHAEEEALRAYPHLDVALDTAFGEEIWGADSSSALFGYSRPLRGLVLRWGMWGFGWLGCAGSRMLFAMCVQGAALVFGYIAFSTATGREAPWSCAFVTYIVLFSSSLLICVSPYIIVPSAVVSVVGFVFSSVGRALYWAFGWLNPWDDGLGYNRSVSRRVGIAGGGGAHRRRDPNTGKVFPFPLDGYGSNGEEDDEEDDEEFDEDDESDGEDHDDDGLGKPSKAKAKARAKAGARARRRVQRALAAKGAKGATLEDLMLKSLERAARLLGEFVFLCAVFVFVLCLCCVLGL